MKFSRLLTLFFLLGIVVITGCKKTKTAEPTPEEQQIALLAKTWVVKTDANSVTLDGADEIANWTGFSANFTDSKTFSTSNVPSGREVVWPASGTWDFKTSPSLNLNKIVRDDNVEIDIIVSETSLKMTFTYTTPGGRTTGTDGVWFFDMVPQ